MPLERVYAVVHVGDEEAGHVNQKITRPGVVKLGVEQFPEHHRGEFDDPVRVYWTRVCETARNRKTPLVSLEPNKKDHAIVHINDILMQAANLHAEKDWTSFKRNAFESHQDIAYRIFLEPVKKMLAEIEKNAGRRVTHQYLVELGLGLMYRRSQKMLKVAEKEGVTDAVVGYVHAQDFQTHSPKTPEPMMLGSASRYVAAKLSSSKERKQAYKKHADLIARLYEIAAKHF